MAYRPKRGSLLDSRQHHRCCGRRRSCRLSHRSNVTEPRGICERQNGAVASDWRLGRKRSHPVGRGAGSEKRHIIDHQSCESATGTLSGLRRGNRSFRGEAERRRSPDHERLWHRHRDRCDRRRNPERGSRRACCRGKSNDIGYSAGRKATIDVTDLIWKRASMKSFSLFAQPPSAYAEAWDAIVPLLRSGAVKPIVARTFPLSEAADALRYLVEGRPFGRIILTI